MKNLILGRWNFIFLLGESGGGKGTLVKNIKNNWLHDLNCSSMGDVLREKSKVDPVLKKLTDQGILIDDATVYEIFKDFATNNSPGLLDGFPRKKHQAIDAIKFIKQNNWRVLVIDIKCDIEVIIERLLSRGRNDDKLDIMYKRNLDHRTFHPIVMEELLNNHDIFDIVKLDGNKPANIVFNDFLLSISRLIDISYFHNLENMAIDFEVSNIDTSIDNALNRFLIKLLNSLKTP